MRKERPKELDFFQPREEKAEGSLVTVFKCCNDGLYRRCKYRDAQDKRKQAQVTQGSFHLDARKKFFTVRMSQRWSGFPRVVVESPLLEISKAVDVVLGNLT